MNAEENTDDTDIDWKERYNQLNRDLENQLSQAANHFLNTYQTIKDDQSVNDVQKLQRLSADIKRFINDNNKNRNHGILDLGNASEAKRATKKPNKLNAIMNIGYRLSQIEKLEADFKSSISLGQIDPKIEALIEKHLGALPIPEEEIVEFLQVDSNLEPAMNLQGEQDDVQGHTDGEESEENGE